MGALLVVQRFQKIDEEVAEHERYEFPSCQLPEDGTYDQRTAVDLEKSEKSKENSDMTKGLC